MKRIAGLACASALLLTLGACVTSEKLPLPIATAQKSATQLPEAELLDVAIELFDPNVPKSEKEQQAARIDPNVRAAEARYMPVLLANTLQGTGYWGQVRVVPQGTALLDLNVSGTILASNGAHLKLAIKAVDATGKQWLTKTYEGEPDTRSYKDGATTKRDPYQNVYVQIAEDLAAARRKLSPAALAQVQRIAQLRFESSVAPYAYGSYLKQDRNGSYTAVRLPASDSPLEQRLHQVRERDFALLDTLDDQYRLSSERVTDSYVSWRKGDYAESEMEAELRRSATARMLMGAVAVVGGIAAASKSGSTAGEIGGAVAVAGGIDAFKSGMGQRAEAKTHSESLKQQIASFSAEVTPQNVDVDGHVLELKGNAEQQFLEWRRLLKQLYENETGVAPPAASGATRQ